MGRKRYSKEFKLQKIEEFKAKIESHKCYCKSIPVICEEISVKYRTFQNWFKKIENITLKQFCQKCKLEYAKYLLLNTKDKICVIAYELGFNYEIDFIQFFKKYINKTPNIYRLCKKSI